MVGMLVVGSIGMLLFAFWPSPRFIDNLRQRRVRRQELSWLRENEPDWTE